MVVSWTNFTDAGAIRDPNVTVAAMGIRHSELWLRQIDVDHDADYSAAKFYPSASQEKSLDHSTLVTISEAILRVILGWRMLISGLSNVRRWPNPVQTASILFPKGATFFGFVATFLMVVGGFGLAAGIQTPISAVMIVIFLIPTFALHWHWLKVLPTMAPAVKAAIQDEKAQNYFRSFDRQSYHSHEVGLRDNLVFVAAAIYFAARGSAGFGVDNWLGDWVMRFF